MRRGAGCKITIIGNRKLIHDLYFPGMTRKITFLLITLLGLQSAPAKAQRLSDPNTLGWYASFNTFHVAKRVSLWLEYQWRRDNLITDWQQSLPRMGVQYHFKNGVNAMVGYAYITTYPYGDYPAGPQYIPEHRIYEQMTWNGSIGRVQLAHRLRLEQRFLGKVDQKAAEHTVLSWPLLHRVRYQIKPTLPLNHKTMQDDTWFIAAFDEIFIGFGKNVNQNIFDQNRIGLLAGYQFNKTFKAEIGAFNQTLQQGALVGGKQVYQYNTGLMVNFYVNR